MKTKKVIVMKSLQSKVKSADQLIKRLKYLRQQTQLLERYLRQKALDN